MTLSQSFRVILMLPLIAALVCASSCNKKEKPPPSSTPPPIFTGPEAFYTTVGSMVQVEGTYPLLVSGYSIVANLPEPTGSREVPQNLRQKLVNEMRKGGFGSAQLHQPSPERVLESMYTAVVRVDGVIPPFATKGSRFDVMVSALEGTQTTSLEGGMLFTTELAPGGASVMDLGTFIKPLAKANGATYINPFADDADKSTRLQLSRRAAILSGGVVTTDRAIRLMLNQPSWTRCRAISDRINERFRKGVRDRDDTAEAKNDSVIEINIPSSWKDKPQRLLSLISNLYVQRGEDFEPQKAAELGDFVAAHPQNADRVAFAWETLGRTALPVVRKFYDHPDVSVRFAALQAGVHLGDERTSEQLDKLSLQSDSQLRLRAAQLMVFLPDSLRAEAALRRLLSDADKDVRIAAYEALADHGDRRHVQRQVFYEEDGKLKFILDVVDTQRQLIFISQTNLPRIVIFNGYTGFTQKGVASVWDNHLMVRTQSPNEPATVFYQPTGQIEGKTVPIAPALANLVMLMGRDPSKFPDEPAFGLPYSRVVNAIYQMHRDGHFGSTEIVLQQSPLAASISEAQRTEGQEQQRPEFETPGPQSQPAATQPRP